MLSSLDRRFAPRKAIDRNPPMRRIFPILLTLLAAGDLNLSVREAVGQAPRTAPAAAAQRGIDLVQQGRCAEAVPMLRRALPHVTDKQVRYHAAMAEARCGMGLQDTSTTVEALLLLQREYPDDPEVLYIATHYFSELGVRASQELAARAPSSFQARKLEAESLESQGKNAEASAIYRKILEDHPETPGIHYRLGQILLAESGSTGPTDQARSEFQKETEVDPLNAAAQFILGELARRDSQWEQAIQHFTQAAKIDAGFSEAYLALGMSIAASGRFGDAVAPLEKYVKMQPDDPAGHYQLAMAYSHTGNKEGAAQQIAQQARAAATAKPGTDTTEGHVAPR